MGRTSKWAGITLFVVVPIVLTIFVWPQTAAPGNEYGTGNWFNWVKTYSALAGCVGFMALRFVHWRGADGQVHWLYEKKWALCFPPLILAINICEAVFRDFQVFSYGAWDGAVINNLWTISGPWNIMNGIAGILNIVTICGWTCASSTSPSGGNRETAGGRRWPRISRHEMLPTKQSEHEEEVTAVGKKGRRPPLDFHLPDMGTGAKATISCTMG